MKVTRKWVVCSCGYLLMCVSSYLSQTICDYHHLAKKEKLSEQYSHMGISWTNQRRLLLKSMYCGDNCVFVDKQTSSSCQLRFYTAMRQCLLVVCEALEHHLLSHWFSPQFRLFGGRSDKTIIMFFHLNVKSK